ncbi:hypothetical protein ACFPZL_05340 [Leucobacter soli]|uniref:Uncharacterized protein n=1 Tax=Leucobacter soli TaxID=2812850 RepID=A0A916NLN9_9MICO|nr:hypothetical protein [Leucobacter soli]CAG7599682.1 hypothetical protein LEUCIP111803_00316 [Leucobacter soli]
MADGLSPIRARKRFARPLALATALLLGAMGLAAPSAAQAANPSPPSGPYSVSGKITFAATDPAAPVASLLRKVDYNEADATRSGLYLSLSVTQPDYSVKSWDYGEHGNVIVNTATGEWTVNNVANGTYRLNLGVTLPNNGYARGLSTTVTVNNGHVAVGTTTIKAEAHLVGTFGSCESAALRPSKMIAENLATGKTYQLEPGQRGETLPTPQCGAGASADFGMWDLYNAPAGDYYVYAEQSGVREYYTSQQTGSQDRSEASTVTLKYWEGNHTRFLYGFSKPIVSKTPQVTTASSSAAAQTVKVGTTLKAKTGTWTAGSTLKYRWNRNGTPIGGATKSSYTLKSTDLKKKISVTVTGTKKGYWPAARASVATKAVKTGTLTTAKPKISGTKKSGKTVKVKRGSWTSGTKFSYRWYRNGKTIGGATKSSYTLKSKDAGKKIKVKVTGKKSGYATTSRTSSYTAKIAKR